MFSFADPEFWGMGSAKRIYRAISYLTNFRRHGHTGLRSRFSNDILIFFYSCYRHENVHNFTEKLIRPENLNEHYYYISQWDITNSYVRYFLNQRKLYDGTTVDFIVAPNKKAELFTMKKKQLTILYKRLLMLAATVKHFNKRRNVKLYFPSLFYLFKIAT